VGSTPTYAPMRFSVSSQLRSWRPLRILSIVVLRPLFPCCAHPATSLTNPRSSSTLSMLCCIPARTLPACSSHCACLAAGSVSSSAHLFVGRSPRAKVDCCRMHRRHTESRGLASCLKDDMAANCTASNLGPGQNVPACQAGTRTTPIGCNPQDPPAASPTSPHPHPIHIRTRHMHFSSA
jgi:hypothetical protein